MGEREARIRVEQVRQNPLFCSAFLHVARFLQSTCVIHSYAPHYYLL